MSEVLVEVTRGSLVECRHRDSVAVTNGKGEVVAYAGDPGYVTYIRSADETNSDCSRKHSGFLAVCMAKGYPTDSYVSPQHPMQKEILHIISEMCDVAEQDIIVGTDGCGVPVHAMPLQNMAIGYVRLSTPPQLNEPYRSAAERISGAMWAFPEMIAGTGGFCTEFLRHTHGRFCGKLGAEAVYCIGVTGRALGIAVKIEDGNYRALYPAVMGVLKQLHLLDHNECEALRAFSVGFDEVGEI